jgi:hypothetical protein
LFLPSVSFFRLAFVQPAAVHLNQLTLTGRCRFKFFSAIVFYLFSLIGGVTIVSLNYTPARSNVNRLTVFKSDHRFFEITAATESLHALKALGLAFLDQRVNALSPSHRKAFNRLL